MCAIMRNVLNGAVSMVVLTKHIKILNELGIDFKIYYFLKKFWPCNIGTPEFAVFRWQWTSFQML